ncbi:sensor histidine kinase [Crenalkalicoccus roseus]|uniref:sensor histidine kinase n=1 Tax=Crenalkalicoccus roseus TaxID=1485588 RepID=UPI001081C4CC|nr:HWE histidine kinase domain-containing protein [Crenalkalicoccus roseus]
MRGAGGAAETGARNPAEAGEAARLDALHRYRILDTPEEEAFDRLALLARELFGTPIALVSLVDETRQWWKAHLGVGIRELPRAFAFCDHAIRQDGVFVVRDAASDPRFAASPLVAGGLRIRFYAGAPLRTPEGHRIGTLAVLSPRPRPRGLRPAERRRLTSLAAMAVDELELRLQARLAREAAAAEARLRRAQEAAGVLAFESGGEPGAALRRVLGLDPEAPLFLGGAPVLAHPEDRPALEAAAARLAAAGGPLRAEFRVLSAEGRAAWVEVAGEVQAGVPAWEVRGVLRDITERRRAEERQALLAREVDHRAKNALAVVQAALRLTPREDPEAFARTVEGRVTALARALSLLAASRWQGAELRRLAEGELRPFLGLAGEPGAAQAHLEGPPVLLATQAAQPLSMVLHELATNAVKHGALSRPGGAVALRWTVEEEEFRLRWAETGGPPLPGPPARRGFGTRVLEATVRDQLGGRIACDWRPEGLACEMRFPARRVLAAAAPSGRDGIPAAARAAVPGAAAGPVSRP